MERLELDLTLLSAALKSLENAILLQNRSSQEQEMMLAVEDSIIKRFEYSYETFWKFLKKYLEKMHHAEGINSPKKVFFASVETKVCTLEEGNIFIKMVNARNETTHTYSLASSRLILFGVPHYHRTMLAVVMRISPTIRDL